MSYFYYLNDDHTAEACDMEKWSEQYEQLFKNGSRCVAKDLIDGHIISTVWLGINHRFYEGEPHIFETIVFVADNFDGIYMDRYSTWDEAVAGHEKAVQWVKDGCKDDNSE